MRRLIALLVLTLAFAGPAGAQQGRIGAVERDAELRGAAEPELPASTLPEPIVVAAPPFSAMPEAYANAGQCRLSCAQDYYFCLAQDDATDCSPGWSGCVLACGSMPGV